MCSLNSFQSVLWFSLCFFSFPYCIDCFSAARHPFPATCMSLCHKNPEVIFYITGFLNSIVLARSQFSTIPSNISLISTRNVYYNYFLQIVLELFPCSFLKNAKQQPLFIQKMVVFWCHIKHLSYTLIKTSGNLPRGKATCLQLRKQFCILFPVKFRNSACRRSTMMKEGHNSLLNVLCIKYSTYKINYGLQLDRHKMVWWLKSI